MPWKESAEPTRDQSIRAIEIAVERIIAGYNPKTAFGDTQIAATRRTELSAKFNQGIPFQQTESNYVATGYVAVSRNGLNELLATAEIGTGVDPAGAADIRSLIRNRYEPGKATYENITLCFKKEVTPNGQYELEAGVGDDKNGYFIKEEGDGASKTLYFVVRNETQDPAEYIKVPFNEWNGDLESIDLDNELTIFHIRYGFLGIAPTEVYVVDNKTSEPILAHTQSYEQDFANVNNPNLPVWYKAINKGNTTDVKIISGSVEVGTINGRAAGSDPSARTESYNRTIAAAVIGDNQPLFAFKNDLIVAGYDYEDINGRTFADFDNYIDSKLLQFKAVSDGTKPVEVDLYILPITEVTATYAYVNKGSSILQVAEAFTVPNLANFIPKTSFYVEAGGSITEDVLDNFPLLAPNLVGVFVYSTAGNNFELRSSILYDDRF